MDEASKNGCRANSVCFALRIPGTIILGASRIVTISGSRTVTVAPFLFTWVPHERLIS